MQLGKTEDGLVVYNVYLRGIPANFSEEILQEHFSTFGEVSSVIIRWNSEKTVRYALVNFKDAESAASALKLKHHFIWNGLKRKRKVVKEADSWWQPNFEIKIESDSLLMMLNDDCLIHIFSFLPTWERIKLSRMNQRFKEFFEITNIRNKTVNLSNLTVMEIGYICLEFGHLIQKIDLEYTMTPLFKSPFGPKVVCRSLNQYRAPYLITKYCSKLRHLNFVNFRIKENTKFRLLKNLTKISLRYNELNDRVCFHLSKLKKLKYLDVSGNFHLTGKYLKDFLELTHLNLDFCNGMNEVHISEFCSSSRIIQNLKSLNINEWNNLETISPLASLENLECLVISSEEGLSVIKDLKKLKHLIIYIARMTDVFGSNCQELTYCTSLETLFIVNGYRQFQLTKTEKNFIFSMTSIKKLGLIRFALDDEDMTKIVAMPKLTHLNIAGCKQISTNGLLHLFEKSNKLQHVDISDNGLFDNFIPSPMIDEIQNKMKKRSRTANCTLYSRGIKGTDEIEDSSLLKIVAEKSVFPGMKLRDRIKSQYNYEFEDHID